MSKTTHKTYVLATDVESSYADLIDETYLKEKAATLDHREFEIVSRNDSGPGATVVTRKQVRAEVPGFAQKFLAEWNTVTQTDVWSGPAADGSRTCTFTVEIKNTPAKITGTLALAAQGENTGFDVKIECKVGIPLLGGKVESLIMTDLEKTAEAEKQFGADWLVKKNG